LNRTKRLLESHGGVNLLVRDDVSFEKASGTFDFPVHHTPDIAFAMGPLNRAQEHAQKIQLLCRTDEEAQHGLPEQYQNQAVDWLKDPTPTKIRQIASRLAWLSSKPSEKFARKADALNLSACQHRFKYGMNLLAQGEVVVTDRLHATIMSTLQDIPVYMVGDKFGKLRTFYDSWLQDAPNVTWWDDFPTALAQAENDTA